MWSVNMHSVQRSAAPTRAKCRLNAKRAMAVQAVFLWKSTPLPRASFPFSSTMTTYTNSLPPLIYTPWGVDGPPGATGVLSGRGGRKRGSPIRSNNEVIHLIQGCHCALLQKLCKMPQVSDTESSAELSSDGVNTSNRSDDRDRAVRRECPD